MKPRLQAAIFDLDGTLADSLADIAGHMNAVLRDNGLPELALDSYRDLVGGGVELLAERAKGNHSDSSIDVATLVGAFRARYRAVPVRHTRPYPGMIELLDTLRSRAIPLGVLSNKPHALTRTVVSTLFSATLFAEVYGEREGRARKPDPSTAIDIAALLGHPPARCAFVGDTDVDIETAHRAGMHAVGVAWGFRPREELLAAGAHTIVETPADLLALFD